MSGDMYDILFEGSAAEDDEWREMSAEEQRLSGMSRQARAEDAVKRLIRWADQQPPETFED